MIKHTSIWQTYLRKHAGRTETLKAEKSGKENTGEERSWLDEITIRLRFQYLNTGDKGVCNKPDGVYEYCKEDNEIYETDEEMEEHDDNHIQSIVPVEYIEGGIPTVLGSSRGDMDAVAIMKAITPEDF